MSSDPKRDSESNVSTRDTPELDTEPRDGADPAKRKELEETEEGLYRYADMPYYLDDIEDVQLYRKGGHHPTHLGDMLNDRFEVVHKLGSGGFGLVWLCYDMVQEKWRAVKVMTAEYSKGEIENRIYGRLREQASPKMLEDSHIIIPVEEFWIQGPNGRHHCLVLPVLGGSVSQWRLGLEPDEQQTATEIRKYCYQVTEAVRFMHHLGICHGDLKPSNILVTLQGIEDMGRDQMLELIGEPELWEVETRSGDDPAPRGPEYIVQPPQEDWWEKHMAGSIAIVDFGSAFFAGNPSDDNAWSIGYAAPEVLLCDNKALRGYHSDIWSLAATLFEIRALNCLFSGTFDLAVRDIEFYLGGLPEPYRSGRYKILASRRGRQQTEEEETTFKVGEPVDATTWSSQPVEWQDSQKLREAREHRVNGTGYIDLLAATLGKERHRYAKHVPGEPPSIEIKYRYPRDEVLQLSDLLGRMLHYDPAKRITIDGVFIHPWVGGRIEVHTIRRLKDGRAGSSCLVVGVALLIYTLASWLRQPPRSTSLNDT
ncbi:hypothetical protein NUW58_g1034 [Xylaria curta]|uniref:Uncharacterized protein n=1 Tax=Xylaria curta TaxID=42375 RepID=A0ACC1PN65_9PEZI|nr:hypothetical protein NUW58_g1034 [Xylaria curta]